METPLNVAHRHQRRAEFLVKVGKFDEALEQHVAAEKALSKVVTTTNSSNVLQSLKLQQEYHIRQQTVVKHKQKVAELLVQHQENVRKQHADVVQSILSTPKHKNHNVVLIQRLLQTLYQHDSLVDCVSRLSQRNNFNDTVFEPVSLSMDDIVQSAVKSPKDNKLRLEELRVCNKELKRIVFSLVNDLEKVHTENRVLRTSVGLIRDQNYIQPMKLCAVPNIAYRSISSADHVPDLKIMDPICELPTLDSVKLSIYE